MTVGRPDHAHPACHTSPRETIVCFAHLGATISSRAELDPNDRQIGGAVDGGKILVLGDDGQCS